MNRHGHRKHGLWLAFALHRFSGVALALFLPIHFYVLSLALNQPERLDGFLRWSEQPLVKAAVYRVLSSSYSGLGEYEQAKELIGRALQLQTGVLGEDDPAVLRDKAELGGLLNNLNRPLEAAETLLNR